MRTVPFLWVIAFSPAASGTSRGVPESEARSKDTKDSRDDKDEERSSLGRYHSLSLPSLPSLCPCTWPETPLVRLLLSPATMIETKTPQTQNVLAPETLDFYREAMAAFEEGGVPYLVGGAYAYARYT